MAEIRWTEEALRWLEDIHDYISQDSPSAAQGVVSGIYERVQLLRDFPEIGHIYRKETDLTVRVLLYGHYRIACSLRTTDAVTILGVFHGALDISRYNL
jgi:plasmid stabilization system protein ParE